MGWTRRARRSRSDTRAPASSIANTAGSLASRRCATLGRFVRPALRRRLPGPDGEVAIEHFYRLFAHRFEAGEQFEEMGAAELEHVLVGLVDGAHRIVHERSRGLFDVAAEDVGDGAGGSEVDEPAGAGF